MQYVYIFLMFLSLLFLILGMTGLERTRKLKKGRCAQATVTALEKFSGAKTVTSLNGVSLITLGFADESGNQVSTQMLGRPIPIGETVDLYYEEGTLRAAGVKSTNLQYALCVVITIFGAVALVASTIAVLGKLFF